MTTMAPDDLAVLEHHVVERLSQAVMSRRGAWRTPVLATIATDGAPTARTVVIRRLDPEARLMEIFTDARSAKIAQIAAEPRVALTFWDPDAAEQLRVVGRAHRVEDASLVDARWEAIGPRGQEIYAESSAGTGRDRLMVLHVVWQEWDWLWIGDITHRRARLHWTAEGTVQAAWIDP
jgi:pyridoxine/pyridoxamine 5'-phosphate oxidase